MCDGKFYIVSYFETPSGMEYALYELIVNTNTLY
jgi:hypothetical protein